MSQSEHVFPRVIELTLEQIRKGNYGEAEDTTSHNTRDEGRVLTAREYLLALEDISPASNEKLYDDCDAVTALALRAEIYHALREHDAQVIIFANHEKVTSRLEPAFAHRNTSAGDCPWILRSRCWYTLQYAIFRYHQHDYNTAVTNLRRAILAMEKTEIPGAASGEKFTGTLSLLYYWIGNSYRQLQQFKKAIPAYQKSMENIHLNLGRHKDDTVRRELGLFRLGNVLAMGLGWTYLRIGELAAAENCLLAAQILLGSPVCIPERRGYAKMLLGMVYRAQAGTMEEMSSLLKRAEALYDHAKRDFKGNSKYLLRLHTQLAALYLNYSPPNLEKAEEEVRNAEKYIAESRDIGGSIEGSCAAHIFRCRITRKSVTGQDVAADRAKLRSAMNTALEVEHMAEDKSQVAFVFESRIEQGETLFEMAGLADSIDEEQDHLMEAVKRFKSAAQLSTYPRHQAICNLHLARIYSRSGQHKDAQAYFDEYTRTESMVQNGFILNFARRVAEEISKTFLFIDPGKLDKSRKLYDACEEKMREFMVSYAKLSTRNKEEAIAKLGVSRQTFINWEKSISDRKSSEKATDRERSDTVTN